MKPKKKILKATKVKEIIFSAPIVRFIPKYTKIVYEVQNAPDKTQNLKKYFYK